MTRLKVGLLGAGFILQAHARALRAVESVDLHAVCDQSQERAASAAAEFGTSATTSTLSVSIHPRARFAAMSALFWWSPVIICKRHLDPT